jgi:hypothetical protein
MASKLSPLAPLGQALALYLGQRNIDAADQQRTETLSRAQTEGQQEMRDLSGMEDIKARIAAANASRFPGIRTWGTTQQKAADERLKTGVELVGKSDPQASLRMLVAQELDKEWTRPTPPAPVVSPVAGVPKLMQAVTTNAAGEQDVKFSRVPDETKVAVSQGGVSLPGQDVAWDEWAKRAVADNQKLGETARASQKLTQTLNQMMELDTPGTTSGPLANPVVWLTGLAKWANMPVNSADLANTETYRAVAQAAVQELIGQYGGNRGLTKEEAAQVAQSLPQLQQSREGRQLLTRILLNAAARGQTEYDASTRNLERALATKDRSQYTFGPVQVPSTPLVAPTPGAKESAPLTPAERRELEQLRRRGR